MNRMNQVTKLLGLKINEEFKIKGLRDTYKITENGVVIKDSEYVQGLILTKLITGEFEIQYGPWKPNDGDEFYYIVFTDDFCIYPDYWEGTYQEILNYKIGNCYRTRKEAEDAVPTWIKFFNSDKTLGEIIYDNK